MALIQYSEMERVVKDVLAAVRAKAAELGLKNGAIGICYNNARGYAGDGTVITFEDLEPGEDRLRIFQLSEGGSHILRDENNNEIVQCFGIINQKIAAAAKVYKDSDGECILSSEAKEEDDIPGRKSWGGCVLYPIHINHRLCGKIYVAVSGGEEDEDEACAWAALQPMRAALLGCYPLIPAKYGKNG